MPDSCLLPLAPFFTVLQGITIPAGCLLHSLWKVLFFISPPFVFYLFGRRGLVGTAVLRSYRIAGTAGWAHCVCSHASCLYLQALIWRHCRLQLPATTTCDTHGLSLVLRALAAGRGRAGARLPPLCPCSPTLEKNVPEPTLLIAVTLPRSQLGAPEAGSGRRWAAGEAGSRRVEVCRPARSCQPVCCILRRFTQSQGR